jgi:hypothetical protein
LPSRSEPPPAPTGRPRLRRLPDAGGVCGGCSQGMVPTPDLVAGCGWPECPGRSPPDDMPAAVLVVRPDGSAVYVPLRDYQAGPDTLNPAPAPKERKPCPPKPSTRTATRRRR